MRPVTRSTGVGVLGGFATVPAPDFTLPPGAKRQNFKRLGTSSAATLGLTSGRIQAVGIELFAGDLLTSMSFKAGGTALVTGTNQWFALYDLSRNLLRQTVDDGATAWAGSVVKTLALTSTYLVTVSGLYYAAINVTATTPPSLDGVSAGAPFSGIVPIVAGSGDTGLTGTAPNPMAALTSTAGQPWCYVS